MKRARGRPAGTPSRRWLTAMEKDALAAAVRLDAETDGAIATIEIARAIWGPGFRVRGYEAQYNRLRTTLERLVRIGYLRRYERPAPSKRIPRNARPVLFTPTAKASEFMDLGQ